MVRIPLRSVHVTSIYVRVRIKIRADLAHAYLKAVWTVEKLFIFNFEFDGLYMLLIKGKMGIL